MSKRIAQRRRSDRRVLVWCLALAGLLHVVVFLVVPVYQEAAVERASLSLEVQPIRFSEPGA